MDYRKNLCIFFIIVLVIPHPVFPAPLGVNGHPSGNTQVQEIHHRQKRRVTLGAVGNGAGVVGAAAGVISLIIYIAQVAEENKRSCTRHDGRCRTSCGYGWYHHDYYNESCTGLICCKNEELEKQKEEERRLSKESFYRSGAGAINMG